MARGRDLILALALGAARATWAAETCDEGRDVTGLGVGIREGAVAVTDLAPESAAARAGLRSGASGAPGGNGGVARGGVHGAAGGEHRRT